MDTGKTVALIKALGGAGGGGGSGLPAVTLADKGKHLVVNGKIQPTSTVIVPEQTASYDAEAGNYPLSNCVPSLFNDEGYVYAVINGIVVSGTPVEEREDFYYLDSPGFAIVRDGNVMYVWLGDAWGELPASITVSAYVGEEVGEWGKEAITTPAAVFDLRPGPNHSVVSGSYSATRAALEQFAEYDGEMPLLLAYTGRGSGQGYYSIAEYAGWQLQTGYIRLILGNVYWHWNEDGSLEYED